MFYVKPRNVPAKSELIIEVVCMLDHQQHSGMFETAISHVLIARKLRLKDDLILSVLEQLTALQVISVKDIHGLDYYYLTPEQRQRIHDGLNNRIHEGVDMHV